MSKRLLSASVTVAVLTLAGLSPAAAATHPPDLPLDPRPDCRAFGSYVYIDEGPATPAPMAGCISWRIPADRPVRARRWSPA